MRTRLIAGAAVLWFVFLSNAIGQTPSQTKLEPYREREAYAVYTAFLSSKSFHPSPSARTHLDVRTIQGACRGGQDSADERVREAAIDYEKQNSHRWMLDRDLRLGIPVELVETDAHDWAAHFTFVSAVGFSKDRNVALFTGGYKCGSLCGKVETYVIRQKDNKWLDPEPIPGCGGRF